MIYTFLKLDEMHKIRYKQHKSDSINNCCAGSIISFEDYCSGGIPGIREINQDGENLSSSQSEQ